MEFEGVKWVGGLMLALIMAVLGGFYRLGAKMSGQHTALHSRIDQVKDDYVRRDDFQKHMERQDRQGEKIEQSILKLDEKIDRLIARK